MECRNSGLCDSRWCQENNIKSPTFYYWIKKLRIERSNDLDEKSSLSFRKPTPQVVVPINVIDEPYAATYQNTQVDTAIIIEMSSITLKIHNNASQSVIQNTIQALRYLC